MGFRFGLPPRGLRRRLVKDTQLPSRPTPIATVYTLDVTTTVPQADTRNALATRKKFTPCMRWLAWSDNQSRA